MEREEKWLLEEKYNGEKTIGFFADLKRLAAGEPLGYVIGHIPFLGCQIWLDSRPLIPRPETEYWAEEAIAAIREADAATPRPLRVLDLCAGSGCIGIAVAKTVPTASVDFAELDERHHATIGRNLEANGIETSQVRIFGGDLFERITSRYDFILANPPYIDPALDRTESSVRNHEPHLALYGGHDGMELIERIIKAAPQYLTENGQLWIEHEPEQVENIHHLASLAGFSCLIFSDQYRNHRFAVLKVLKTG